MGAYAQELADLQDAYRVTLNGLTREALVSLRATLNDRDVYFVGSGGTFPVAELAASLHQRYTGRLARATTPLRLIETLRFASQATVVLLSARARHPDTALAAAHARAYGHPVVLVTQRAKTDLVGELGRDSVTVLTLPPLPRNDGFLATSSVLAMATTFAAAYAPEALNGLLRLDIPLSPLRDRLLVLHGEVGRPAALDIEVRASELGLADVQVADYRNFAHGRHVGLQRRLNSTSVVGLVSPADASLAERTLAALPEGADIRLIRVNSDSPAGTIELLASAMSLPLALSAAAGIEPSKPRVPPFGRALYHLPYRRLYSPQPHDPVERKLGEPFGLPKALIAAYRDAYFDWVQLANAAELNGLVLDYDGTVVRTTDRYEVPTRAIQEALIGVLEMGVPVAFATGRGESLYRSLREWVPPNLWCRVLLGLHSGAWMQELSEDLEVPAIAESAALQALQILIESGTADVVSTGRQISIRPRVPIGRNQLRELVASLTASVPGIRIAASAHSVDLTEHGVTKQAVLEHFESLHGAAFAIGDQGGVDGNDFELLSATRHSISVDQCSSDPTRCWAVTNSSITGPDALAVVLRSISVRRSRASLRLKPALSRQ